MYLFFGASAQYMHHLALDKRSDALCLCGLMLSDLQIIAILGTPQHNRSMLLYPPVVQFTVLTGEYSYDLS